MKIHVYEEDAGEMKSRNAKVQRASWEAEGATDGKMETLIRGFRT